MKKKYNFMLLLILGILLVGCGKKLSNEDIIKEWDKNVSYCANLNTDLITNDSLTEQEVIKRISNIKNEIQESDKKLKKYKGDKEMIDSLESINKQIILSMEHTDNMILGIQSTPQQEESSFLIGEKSRVFSNKYNDGQLPDSLTIMINTLIKTQNND